MVRRHSDRLAAVAASFVLFIAFVLAAINTSPPNGALPSSTLTETQGFLSQGPDSPSPLSDEPPIDPSALPSGGMPEHEHESKLTFDRPLGLIPVGSALSPWHGIASHLVGELLPGHFTPPSQPPDFA